MNKEGGKDEELREEREQRKNELRAQSQEDEDIDVIMRLRDLEEERDRTSTYFSRIDEEPQGDEKKELIEKLLKRYVLKYIKR
jgi:hypothetical protein